MGKYFGTDGVRAIAGQSPLVADFIEKLGYVSLQKLQAYAKIGMLMLSFLMNLKWITQRR